MNVKKCLIIDWVNLPTPLKKHLAERYHSFRNDVYLPMSSEFSPKEITLEGIQKYWEDQKQTNSFTGTLEEFIEQYDLKLEMWIIEQKWDLSEVDKILLKVSW